MEYVMKQNPQYDQNPYGLGIGVRILGLVAGIIGSLLIIFWLGPALDRVDSIHTLASFIEERDIDAGALYYTEIEEFSEANTQMENTMDYMPK